MKKFGIRKLYLFFSSLFIFIIHIPFVFAKSKPLGKLFADHSEQLPAIATSSANPDTNNIHEVSVYDSLRLGSLGLGRQVFNYAMKGFTYMKEMGTLANDEVISIVDFSKPSSQKRLFVIDLRNYKLLFNTYVAHGVQSGKEFANRFSNAPESNKSSLGFYETLNTYNGGNGYSLKLQGIERGINDNANRRAIVMHGAGYVDERLIRCQGYIGRSWGCPAVPESLHRSIIDKIKNGTCLFIFSPNMRYLSHSKVLNGKLSPALAMNRKVSGANARTF
jgi:hypothetical protein